MSSTSHQHDWIYVNDFQARCALCRTVRLELAFRVPCDEAHRYFGTLTEAVADADSRGEFDAIEEYDEEARIWFTIPLEAANAARPADLRFADVELRPRSSRLDFLISGDDE